MLILKNMDQGMLAREINSVFYRSLYQDGKEPGFALGGHVHFLADFFLLLFLNQILHF